MHNLLELTLSITINLEVNDVNTVLEGLGRVQDNSARIAYVVREQANAQLQAQQAAAEAAQKTAEDGAAGSPDAAA